LSVSLVDLVLSRRGERVHGVSSVVVVVGLLDCDAGEDVDTDEEYSAKVTAAAAFGEIETDDMDDDDTEDDDDDVRAIPSSVVGGLLDREADVDTGADVAIKCSSMLKQMEESG